MFILNFFVTLIIIVAVKIHLHKRRLLKNIRHLPAANGLPLVGVGLRFIGKSTTGIYNELIKFSETYQNPSILWFGPTLVVIISSAEDMQTVLNSPHCLQKAYVYDLVGENDGIFKSKAHIWKQHRKLLNPTFNHKILSSFIPIFNEKSKIMADNLKQLVHQKDPFDIFEQFLACTFDMVCATTLGANLEFQRRQNTDILDAILKYYEVVAQRMVKLWLHSDWIYKRSKLYKVELKLRDVVEAIPREIHQRKKSEFDQSKFNSSKNIEQCDEYREPQIFVNQLLQLQLEGHFDDRIVLDQIITMLVGGNEPSALTSSHVILMLAIHQDVQERVFQEIKSAHSSQYSDTDADVMTKLNYLEMVMRETMRLLPVAPFLGRETLDEVKLSNCTIPKGTLLLLAVTVLHRDKSVWGLSPEKFNPDHFLPEKVAERHPYAYLPFSGGPRGCIGRKYARMSVKVMISALVRRYKFTTDIKFEDITPKWDVTLKIANRHMVRVEPRIY